MEDRLYYVEGPDGDVLGPMSMIQILEGIAAEAILESARICEVGRQEWIELSEVIATREMEDFEEPEEEGVPIETELVDTELSETDLHEIQSAVLQDMDRDSRSGTGRPLDSTAYSEEPVIINPDAYFSPLSVPPAADAREAPAPEAPPYPDAPRYSFGQSYSDPQDDPSESPSFLGANRLPLDTDEPEVEEVDWQATLKPLKSDVPPAPGRPSTILSDRDFATSEELESMSFGSSSNESEEQMIKDEWVEDFRLEMQETKGWDDEPEATIAPAPSRRVHWAVPIITVFGVIAILVLYFFMAKGKYHRASQAMAPAAVSAEKRAEAKTLKDAASVKSSQGDHEGAIPLLTKAVDLDPTMGEARKDLAHALAASGREGPAIEEISKYLVVAPDDLAAQRERLDWMLRTGKQGEAGMIYGDIATSRPDSGPLQTMAGLAKGTSEDALQFLQRAVELDPKDVEAWTALSSTYFELDRYPEAVKSFETAFALRQPSEEQLQLYAEAKRKAKTDEPEEPVAPARSADFTNTIMRVRKSLERENFDDARREVATAQKKYVKDAEAMRNVKLWNGIIEFEQGEFEKAIDVFESLDQNASYEASGWGRGAAANWMARARLANGDLRGAVQAFDLVRDADPDEAATARLWEGVALQMVGMGDVAKRTWKEIPEEVGKHVQKEGKGAVKTAQFLTGALTEKEYSSSVSAIAGFENDMHFFLGRSALDRADSLAALEHFRQAIESSQGREFPYSLAKELTTAKSSTPGTKPPKSN
jgi:tetratricopeptide (TPR) repeat protein